MVGSLVVFWLLSVCCALSVSVGAYPQADVPVRLLASCFCPASTYLRLTRSVQGRLWVVACLMIAVVSSKETGLNVIPIFKRPAMMNTQYTKSTDMLVLDVWNSVAVLNSCVHEVEKALQFHEAAMCTPRKRRVLICLPRCCMWVNMSV